MNAKLAMCCISVSVLFGTAVSMEDPHDSVLFSHLVIHGVVEEVSEDHVPYHEWAGENVPKEVRDFPIAISRHRLRILDVLKGSYKGEVIDLVSSRGGPLDERVVLKSAEQYVLCVEYTKKRTGGYYFIRSRKAVFVRSDGSWVRDSDREKTSLDAIRAKVGSTTPQHVASHADVIAVGTLCAVQNTVKVFDANEQAEVRECVLKVSSLLKGDIDGDTVRFQMIVRGPYRPAWRVPIPWVMNVGETWYVFLKKGEIGYYPFAGTNGLFRVEGTTLVYDNAVTYPYSRTEVNSIVREVSR